jgi:hypothetical protein
MPAELQHRPTAEKETSMKASGIHAGFFPDSFFDPEDAGDVPPKRWLTSNGLHGFTSHATVVNTLTP